jgi:WD40 repeat protein
MAFSGSARMLALGTDRGTVELWNLKTGQIAPLGNAGAGRVTTVRFTPGDHYLRAGVQGSTTEAVWDLKTGAAMPIRVGPMERSAFSTDGKLLATSETNYAIKLWDLSTLRERSVLRGHRWTVYAMTFSPDSKLLATGGLDAVARLWDVASGTELTRPLRGHLQGVTGLAFSPDGKALATSSTDNTVKVWNVATGRELFSATGASQAIFSNDGNTLLFKTSQSARLLHIPTMSEIDGLRNGELSMSD